MKGKIMELYGSNSRGWSCPRCKHLNPERLSYCENCQGHLAQGSAYTGQTERPGCVTAYVLLMAFCGGLLLLAGMTSAATPFTFLMVIALAGLYFAYAYGLWKLKNWARILLIGLHGLSLAVSVISLLIRLGGGAGETKSFSLVSVIGWAISGYIIYWFASNGDKFD